LIRKAGYCRCGILFLDQSGRVTALNPDFVGPEDLKIKEGSQLPDELCRLDPGQWLFWGRDWFVQAAGRKTAEILVFRRLRMAGPAVGSLRGIIHQ